MTQDEDGNWEKNLLTDTVADFESAGTTSGKGILALTILGHPDPGRVGDRSFLSGLDASGEALLSRNQPVFEPPRGRGRRPLADPRVSRSPIRLHRAAGGALRLDCRETRTPVAIDGVQEEGEPTLDAAAIARGVILVLAQRVTLLLHTLPSLPEDLSLPRYGLVGESPAIAKLRAEIHRVVDLDVPVLLRGETGTGKELVARAIHDNGPRTHRSFVAVNMGAIPATIAASELFGAARGAYTGAERRRLGYFQKTHGGTLFLDEIGETPPEIQVMLLRALESSEIQPVGAEDAQRVDVRIITATDTDLQEAADRGAFRAPLLHRLTGYEILIPPLRERREDIGRLLYHFLRRELAALGAEGRLDDPGPKAASWLPAEIVERLALYDWPGNVRQLINVARQLVIGSRGEPRAKLTPQIERMLTGGPASPANEAPRTAGSRDKEPGRSYRDPSEVGEEELLAALRANEWQVKQTAAALGVSRTSLYALMDRCARVRKASELQRDEIEECYRRCGGSLEAMVNKLEVSKSALKMRMSELGLR